MPDEKPSKGAKIFGLVCAAITFAIAASLVIWAVVSIWRAILS